MGQTRLAGANGSPAPMFSAKASDYCWLFCGIGTLPVGPIAVTCKISRELAFVPLLADCEVERARHDQDRSNRVRMPMGHDLHARQKFDAVDVQPGLGGVAEQRHMLRCSGKPFVDNILWKLNNAGISVLSVSWGPYSGCTN